MRCSWRRGNGDAEGKASDSFMYVQYSCYVLLVNILLRTMYNSIICLVLSVVCVEWVARGAAGTQ